MWAGGSYAVALAMIGVTVIGTLSASVARAADEIIVGEVVIEAGALHPEVLITEPERRVVFVNRSGRPVHLTFLMQNHGEHTLFQVTDQIWAVFHHVGWHPFVVHRAAPGVDDLYGAVEVVGDSFGGPDPRVCSGITVQGACLER